MYKFQTYMFRFDIHFMLPVWCGISNEITVEKILQIEFYPNIVKIVEPTIKQSSKPR